MNKVPFGIDAGGFLRDAYEVPNGLGCGCVCPVCGARLVARQGEIVAWHFAHIYDRIGSETDDGCGETTVHKVAKQVLLSSSGKTLHLPALPEYSIGISRGKFRCKLLRCATEVLVERANRRVDVLATTQIVRDAWPERGIAHVSRRGGPLIIEIRVSNPKDEAYVADVSSAKMSAIEISLSTEDVFNEIAKGRGDGLSALKRLVLGPRIANRKWLHFEPAFLGWTT